MRLLQRGMSLVEVMVAVVIGMIGILIITQAYITSDNFNRATLGEGGAQMNGLLALYTIERDLRMSGWGINNANARACGNMHWYYNGVYSTNNGGSLPNVRVAPVVITADSGTPSNPDTIQVMYGSDAERMMPTTITPEPVQSSLAQAVSTLPVDASDGFAVNDLILLASSSGCTLRKVTGLATASLQLASTQPHNPGGWGTFTPTYANNDVVMNLGNAPVLRTYLISNGRLASDDGLILTGAATRTDVVDSIVDMRALYGKDTDGNNVVDTYNNTTPTTEAGWKQVLSIKVGILARIGNYEKPSTSGGNCDATTTAPTWSGGSFPKIDISTATSQDRCYRYRVFETTVPLRNMIWAAS